MLIQFDDARHLLAFQLADRARLLAGEIHTENPRVQRWLDAVRNADDDKQTLMYLGLVANAHSLDADAAFTAQHLINPTFSK